MKTQLSCSVRAILCLLLMGMIIPFHVMYAQWIQRVSGTKENFTDVVMLDTATVIVVGRNGSILKTTDSGATWRNTAPQLDCNPALADCFMRWNAVSFCDSLHGIVVGDSITLLTTDGGEQWQFCSLRGSQVFLTAFYRIKNLIYVGDDSGRVYLSIDSGKTWNDTKISNQAILSLFFYASPNMSSMPIYALSPFSAFTTITGFNDWKEEYLPITNWGSATRGNDYKWGDPAFIVGYDGQLGVMPVILKKTYPDTVWQKYIFIPPMLPEIYFFKGLNDITVPTPSIAFACGNLGTVVKTIDSGGSWIPLKTEPKMNLHAIDFFNEHYGITVGDSGTILFTSSGGEIAIDVKEYERVPTKFTLDQNYPNPFNPTTEIRCSVRMYSHMSLRVFDLLGREVALLVNEEKPAGSYSVKWDASALPSGVYFYRLEAVGQNKEHFVETKKLVLLR
jgi:hypothetical protein